MSIFISLLPPQLVLHDGDAPPMNTLCHGDSS